MAIMTTPRGMRYSEALQRLEGMCAHDQEPALSEAELVEILDRSRVVDRAGYPIEDVRLWEPETTFKVGAIIVPTIRNGHAYICVTAGESGETEPQWDAVVSDGTVEWEQHDQNWWVPTYDLNYAAYEAWGLKAAKAASRISFSTEGATFNRDQYLANCRTMQEFYAQRIVASPSCS